jgi:hypothetical protein
LPVKIIISEGKTRAGTTPERRQLKRGLDFK